MTLRDAIKMLLLFFGPTSLFGLFYLYGLANSSYTTVTLITPIYLAFIGNLFIKKYEEKWIKVTIVMISFIATIQAIHMLFLPNETWQYVLRMPNNLDSVSAEMIRLFIGMYGIILIICYPLLNVVLSKPKR